MIRKNAGNAVVAFVLTVPFVLLLFLMFVDIARLSVEKMRLEHLAFELARETAISDVPPELGLAYVEARLHQLGRSSVEARLQWRELPNKPILLLELTLTRRRAPSFPSLRGLAGLSFDLTAIAWEPRC